MPLTSFFRWPYRILAKKFKQRWYSISRQCSQCTLRALQFLPFIRLRSSCIVRDFCVAVPEDAGVIIAAESGPFRQSTAQGKEILFPPAKVIEVHNAHVQTHASFVCKDERLLFWTEERPNISITIEKYQRRTAQWLAPQQRLTGPVLCLGHISHRNYYHLILDLTTQITICKKLGICPSNVVVCGKSSGWQKDLLRCFFDEERIVEVPYKANLLVEKLWMVSPPYLVLVTGGSLYYRSDILMAHREYILKKLGITVSSKPTKRLFVVRHGVARSLANEWQLQTTLERYGFELIEPGEYSFREQVEMFASAEMIVGVHGAGLSNLLFAPIECAVCELLPKNFQAACFQHLANSFGQPYTPVAGGLLYRGTFTVDPHPVRDWLDSLEKGNNIMGT